MAKRRAKSFAPFIAIAVVIIAFALWVQTGIRPTATGAPRYIRYEHRSRLVGVLADLQRRGIVKNTRAMQVYALLTRRPQWVTAGTFQLAPGMSASTILAELTRPIRQNVRIPETNWANRTAHYLAKKEVVDADDYMRLVADPSQFKGEVSFPLQGTSLEGYLYPDTYDLPPLIGARAVILRQLKNFERKVWKKVQPKDMPRVLTIASMAQMESGRAKDLPKIVGVIENRLKKHMPLQIDSTLLYGIQKWRRLTFADYHNIHSPYNTYTHEGLPPGPICSPTIDSIEAVLNPAKSDFLYYVALPDGETVFSRDYGEHLKKIKERKKELAELAKKEVTP